MKMMIRMLALSMGLTAYAAPAVAAADALPADYPPVLAEAHMVDDGELADIRGGFLNVNGMMIDFSFMSRVEINGDVAKAASFSAADLGAIASGASMQNIIPPTVIQNADNNASIALQQVLNMNVTGATAMVANQAQMHQSDLQNAMAFH